VLLGAVVGRTIQTLQRKLRVDGKSFARISDKASATGCPLRFSEDWSRHQQIGKKNTLYANNLILPIQKYYLPLDSKDSGNELDEQGFDMKN
jgi:hypothetical protein